MTDEIEFEGRKFREIEHRDDLEAREEMLDRYHYDRAPERCPECFNVNAYCACVNPIEVMKVVHEARRVHPSMAAIGSICSPEDRERMLRDYAERGARDLERLVNGEPPLS